MPIEEGRLHIENHKNGGLTHDDGMRRQRRRIGDKLLMPRRHLQGRIWLSCRNPRYCQSFDHEEIRLKKLLAPTRCNHGEPRICCARPLDDAEERISASKFVMAARNDRQQERFGRSIDYCIAISITISAKLACISQWNVAEPRLPLYNRESNYHYQRELGNAK